MRGWQVCVVALALVPSSTRAAAEELDAQGRAMLDPLREQALRPAALIARLGLDKAAMVADVGAGPGFLSLPLARAIPRGRLIATDVQPEYLKALVKRAREAGVTNIETRTVEPGQPGLADASVDLVVLCQVDHYLADRARYFAALQRALRS